MERFIKWWLSDAISSYLFTGLFCIAVAFLGEWTVPSSVCLIIGAINIAIGLHEYEKKVRKK